MPHYRVTVSRLLSDAQWRTIDVETTDALAAEAAALAIAEEDESFWESAKIDPLEATEAEIDFEPVPIPEEEQTK